MADTGRLTTLLEQYRDRLHTRGEEGHDEDITYLMQVLESPLMKEYLLGSSPKSEAALIQEVTTALESQEHDVHLSPNSKRRRHLARKASLRALKLALTPQSSPSSSPRVVQKANEKRSQRGSSPEFPLVHQMMARGYGNRSGSHESSPSPLTGYNNRSGSHESIPSPRWPREGFESHAYHPDDHNEPQVNSPPEDQIVPQDPSYSIDHIYISPYTGKHEPPVIETSTSPAEPEERDHTQQQMLFNSTNTLIEQTDLLTEQGDGKMMSSSSGGSEIYSEFIRKGLKSEDIKTPEMENSQDEESLQELPLMRPPPTSSVPRDQQHVALPVLPSYSEALSSQQRVKSYEDLLMDKMGHLNNSPVPATTPPGAPPPYYYPRGGPTTTGLPTQNVPTDHPRGAQHQQQQMLTISLVKGPQGLGLSINRKKSARKGEISIYVQDLQPGGLAEREGFHKGDYLVSINKQNLSGIGLPTAVALLQQAKGKVEIVLLRQEGGASVGMETALSPTSLPQIPLPINMPAPVNIQPISTKAKDPPPQVAMPMSAPPTSPKIKDPPVLKSLPPIKHHASPSPPPQLSHQSSLSSLKHSPISPLTPPTTPSSKSSEQSKKQKLVTIDLPNEGRDLGFSLIPDEKGNTRVNSIVPEGTAERDGRLQPGDQLVAINGHSVTRLDLSAVIEVLREGRAMGHTLRLVVARAAMQMADIEQEEEDEEEEEIASDSDSCSDYEDCEVELVKPVGQGLGITINALVNDEKGEDRGIYIGSVNPSGLAGMTGKVFSKDRIIKVNQHSLKSLSNMEAANILRNCGQSVRLGLRRQVKPSRPFKVTVIEEGPGINMSDGMKVSRKYNQTGQEEEESSRGDRRLKGDGLFNGLDSEDKQQTESGGDNHHLLKEKWRHRVSINRTIRIAHISRPDPSISLGFMMESIVLNDDTGQPGTGNIRHVIQSIREGGPTEQSNVLMVGDELLEVNGKSLVGVAHDEATQLVQSTSKDVTIVVCRSRIDGDSEIKEETTPAGETPVNSDSNLLITTTSESEDDHRCSSSSALTPSSNPALHSIYLNSTIPGFCRRFERQSWRERHAELTRKLKERFEIRRELYYRNFQERLDELQKVEQEMEERNRRLKEAEEKQKAEVEEKRSSLQSGFDYSSYTSPIGYYSSGVNEMGVAEEPLPTGHRDSMASEDSSAGVLSPVPGSGLWENDVVEVELPRGDDGLGFSILDYADPVSPGDHVILVHSLVPGGTAEMDNRLLKGDKLISVNGVSVVNHSLEFTVEQLKSTSEDGLVHITVSHSIPDTPDIDSTPSSFSPDNFTQFLHGSVSEEAEGEEEDSSGSGPEERERKREELKHQQRKKEGAALIGIKDQRTRQSSNLKSRDDDDDQPLNEDPLIAGWQEKGPLNEEVEESLPPYTEVDPLDAKKGRVVHLSGRERRRSNQGDGRSVTPATVSTSAPSQQLLFSRTRSDEPALHSYNGQLGGLVDSHLRLMESTSEETLVASSSHQDLHFSSNQPSPKQHSSPQMRGRSIVTNSNLSNQEYSRNMNQVSTFSPSRSQEDSTLLQEGLSPDTSDTGDHSAEMEPEPRSIEILKGANPLGMSLTEDKGFILVKKIDSSSVLGRDGRIRAGDRILSINDKSLDGLAISKVRSILKRASSNRNTKVKITYLPAPFTMPVGAVDSNVQNGITGSSSSHTQYTQSHPLTHQPYTMRQMQPHPMIPSHMGHNLPSMVQSQQGYQWMQGQHMGYSPAAPLQTRPQVNLQAPYIEQPIPIKPPPPPYPVYQGPMNHSSHPPQQHYQQPLNWNITGMDYQPGGGQMSWNVGLQNAMQYGGGEYLPASQYPTSLAGGGLMGTSQQMSKPKYQQHVDETGGARGNPMRDVTQPHPSYQTDRYHQYMQYPLSNQRSDGVGRMGMRTGNYDMKQTRNESSDGVGRMGMRTGNYDMKQTRNESSKASWSGRNYTPTTDNYPNRTGSSYLEPIGPPRIVELKRDTTGSLGISLGLPEDGIEGVVIIDLSPSCSAMNKGRLLLGDRILEVNGHNLRHATQHEAVSIIKYSRDPMKMLIQSYSGPGAKKRFQNSPLHSNDGSWAIDEEEDERLRQIFPNANGYLFEVILNKGNGGLGLSIWKTDQTQNVVIMQVKPGSLADKAAKIKVGDEILQVNDCRVIGWRHEEVSRLLKQSPPLVKMILIRPLPILTNPTPSALPTSTAGIQNLRQKLHVLQEQQKREETDKDTMPKEAAIDEGLKKKNSTPPVDMSGLTLVKAITIPRDDELGLGFNVSEPESQGEQRVVVSSIVPNGPAEQEGQLMVGDNIISIDGHKVIGAKYEKVTHLLQQARSRGHVDLIISKTRLPAQLTDKIESTPHKRRNMGEKRKRVRSEGVTLRNRMAKKPQVRSKRRPVSVDAEMKYDLSDITRINSQSSKEGGSSSGSHSNRNSHILSENEMRQDLFPPSGLDQEIKPGKACTIEVFSGNEPLGISILDGAESYREGLFIHKVHPNTPAALDDRLRMGDRILGIGNTSMETVTKDEALAMLRETQSVIQLTVYRQGHQGEEQTSRPIGIGGGNIETVELMKPEQRGVGLMIIGDETNGGVLVSDVVEGEAAAFTNRIRKGDKILAINGEDISSASRDTAISLLQNCRGKVTLRIQHLGENVLKRNISIDSTNELPSLAHYPPRHTEYKSPTRGVSRLPPSYHSPSPPTTGGKPHPHEPPPYMLPTEHSVLRDSRGTTPLRSDPSFGEEDTYPIPPHQHRPLMPSTNQYRDVVGQSIPDGSTHMPQSRGDIPPPPMRRDARNVRIVHLQRGPSGLGFSIVGGKGSPNGDLPICVKTVSPNSMAGKEGLLKPGDVIMAVNGISFDNYTHQAAVETLKRCTDSIMLTICTP